MANSLDDLELRLEEWKASEPSKQEELPLRVPEGLTKVPIKCYFCNSDPNGFIELPIRNPRYRLGMCHGCRYYFVNPIR